MTIPYQCQLVYKGQPVTVVIPNLAVPRCGNCGELLFDYEADAQIHEAFAAQTRKLDQPASCGGQPRPYPEPKQRELTDDEKEEIRKRIEKGDGDTNQLAREFACSSSQVAGIKAAMNR